MVVFETPVPDIAVLKSQVKWDVVFSLWDSQAIGTNKAIGSSLSVEVEDLIDPLQRSGGGFWESGPGKPGQAPRTPAVGFSGSPSLSGNGNGEPDYFAGQEGSERDEPPPRRSFDSLSPSAATYPRAHSWTLDTSLAPPTLSTSTSDPAPELLTPSPTTDHPTSISTATTTRKRPAWLTSKRTRSRSHSPSPSKSGASTDEEKDPSSKEKGKRTLRRPLSPLFTRSRSPAPTPPPQIPGLRFPVMHQKSLQIEWPPLVDPDGKVYELPPVTLNIRVGFSSRGNLLRNFLATLIHDVRVKQDPSYSAPIETITIVDALLVGPERFGASEEEIDALFGGRDEVSIDEFVQAWEGGWFDDVVERVSTPVPVPEKRRPRDTEETTGSSSSNTPTPPPVQESTCFLCNEAYPPPDPTSNVPYATQVMNHTIVCASRDYTAAASRMLNRKEFLTESAAARGLYTSLLARLGLGTYKVGSHEGYILVQDRETGQLVEEYIPSYVRLGIQLLYRTRVTRNIVETNSIANLFRGMTVGQGAKCDDPRSAGSIAKFIRTYSINVDEIEKPVSEYRTLNDFFVRRLKPGVRVLEGDEGVLVSAADCRLTCFPNVGEATRVWIKGAGFTITRLLGGDAAMGSEFADCTVIVHRLAPQDYHRFHSPVSGRVVGFRAIKGAYYTVNPMAVRSPVDVFGENAREVCYIDTERWGLVAVVAVGAMMVGSVVWSVGEGDQVMRMDEIGGNGGRGGIGVLLMIFSFFLSNSFRLVLSHHGLTDCIYVN